MSNKLKIKLIPTTILEIEDSVNYHTEYTVHICAVYGGNNALLFRCPCCGTIHAHGAGSTGGASDSKKILPHCTGDRSHFLAGKSFQWCLHEQTEGMDISLAGDLTGKNKPICARRPGEAGYDQLENGRVDDSPAAKLVTAYGASGVKHG